MRRFLIRLGSTGYKPGDTLRLLTELRSQLDEFRSVVKNLRISGSAIEFDLYAIHDESKAKSIAKLEKIYGKLLTEKDLEKDPISLNKTEVIALGVELFNEERFWECHETVEQIWRQEAKGQEKDVQQGLILAASALVHFQKNENGVCLGMIPRALAKLNQWPRNTYLGLNVGKLKDELRKVENSRDVRAFKI